VSLPIRCTSLGYPSFKGLSHEIFGPVFWAVWMDVSRPECEPLVVLKSNDAPLILDNYFQF
jgi:hypothetical protein